MAHFLYHAWVVWCIFWPNRWSSWSLRVEFEENVPDEVSVDCFYCSGTYNTICSRPISLMYHQTSRAKAWAPSNPGYESFIIWRVPWALQKELINSYRSIQIPLHFSHKFWLIIFLLSVCFNDSWCCCWLWLGRCCMHWFRLGYLLFRWILLLFFLQKQLLGSPWTQMRSINRHCCGRNIFSTR